MPIEIQQNEAYKFDSEFLNQLPIVEKAMLSRNINPSAFTIAKSSPRSQARYGITPLCYDYTVTIAGESLTVTYPGDQSFLEFFLAQCVAGDKSRARSGALSPSRTRNSKQVAAATSPMTGPFNRTL